MLIDFKKLLLPSLLMFPAIGAAQFLENQTVMLSNESRLSINGTSNVTDFSCISQHHLEGDSLDFDYRFDGKKAVIEGSSLFLNVEGFDCRKKGINRDFRKTLKYKEYPHIKITLNELSFSDGSETPQSALVTIEIAGVQREYEVPLNEVVFHSNKITAHGNKRVSMRDFNLSPPSVLLGMIKVRAELDIDFELVINSGL